ncbi:MAG TPA: hypothetical protein VF631_00660 [Allosphingosinicella sp.]|uniref:hypothetical protein n=1 Tax=Allosphingosinicella sp. TaxID=2823234 RepID=UPI002F28A1AD
MTPFAPDQYIILALVFALGLVLGMYLLAGGKWKRRYREEVRRREALEVEHRRLEKQHASALPVDRPAGTSVHHDHLSASEAQPVQPRASRWGFGRAKH